MKSAKARSETPLLIVGNKTDKLRWPALREMQAACQQQVLLVVIFDFCFLNRCLLLLSRVIFLSDDFYSSFLRYSIIIISTSVSYSLYAMFLAVLLCYCYLISSPLARRRYLRHLKSSKSFKIFFSWYLPLFVLSFSFN